MELFGQARKSKEEIYVFPESTISVSDGWTDVQVESMLYIYKANEEKLKTDKKGFYKLISSSLQRIFKIHRDAASCEAKMKTLKEDYKKVIDNKKRQ